MIALGTTRFRADAAAPNWSQFRGNPRLTGVATTLPPEALKLRWTYEAGEAIESSAAIVDGAVYVGSSKGELLAIDLETGTLRWKYSTGEAGFIGESSPAVSADAVFIGDLAGVFHAVSIRDGRKLWTFKADDEIRSSPVLVDDLVLIGSHDTHLYALESKSGKVRWKLQTDGPVHATPAIHNGVIYIGGCDEQFRGSCRRRQDAASRCRSARTWDRRRSSRGIGRISARSAPTSSRSI